MSSLKVPKNCTTTLKLLVYGYIRCIEKIIQCNIPLLITLLCLAFCNDEDSFDEDCRMNQLDITHNEVIKIENNDMNSTAWLKRIIFDGVYRWKFEIKITRINKVDAQYRDILAQFFIGIYHATQENKKKVVFFFDNFCDSYLMCLRRFYLTESGFRLDKYYETNEYLYFTQYQIIMTLNMNELTLKFEMIDDKIPIITRTLKIENKPYSAGVILGHSSYSVKLIQSSFVQ